MIIPEWLFQETPKYREALKGGKKMYSPCGQVGRKNRHHQPLGLERMEKQAGELPLCKCSTCPWTHRHRAGLAPGGGRVHRGKRAQLPSLTFEQLHMLELKGNVVFLGKDVDGTARLGKQVQVELQPHPVCWAQGVEGRGAESASLCGCGISCT